MGVLIMTNRKAFELILKLANKHADDYDQEEEIIEAIQIVEAYLDYDDVSTRRGLITED